MILRGVLIKVASVFLHDDMASSGVIHLCQLCITTAKCLVLKHHRRGWEVREAVEFCRKSAKIW